MNYPALPSSPRYASVFGDALPDTPLSGAALSGAPLSGALGSEGQNTVHLASLRAHAASGFTYDVSGPNCVLRWANVPSGHRGAVDVVIHFHGHQQHNRMTLQAKANASGVDLSGTQRPTIGLVPHGLPRVYQPKGEAGKPPPPLMDAFSFPAISTLQELNAFVDEALAAFAAENGGVRPSRGRVILTGHSGGGAALALLMRSIGTNAGVHGFQYYDGTYGGEATLTQRQNWIETAIARDAQALATIAGDAERRAYMNERGGHMRIVFIDGTQTAAVARATDTFMRARLSELVSDTGLRAFLRRYYRAQKVTHPRQVYHGVVPRICGARLLADGGNDLQPETTDLPVPTARARGFDEDDGFDAEAMDAITMPVLSVPERAADAPNGSAFIASLGSHKGVERENRIFEQIRAGNMPASLLMFHTVRLRAPDRGGTPHDIEYYVTPDYVSIGRETDCVRIPMDPVTAQRVADHFDCLLPTARMVEQIYQAAPTKLAFIYGNYAGTPRAHLQDASQSYLDHSRAIDAQLRRPPTILTAGHKKELIITNGYIRQRRQRDGTTKPAPMLAFYGAYTAAGEPIQASRSGTPPRVLRGMPSFAHEPRFVDYSHGVRLVWPMMKVDGQDKPVADVLRDSQLALLLAAEGPIAQPRYTLDRSGRPVSARTLEALSNDPLGLDTPPAGAFDAYWSQAQGYGDTWDTRLRTTIESFLREFKTIPVRVGSDTLDVHPPYFMNHANSANASGRTAERHRTAVRHREAAPAALRSLIGESRFRYARVGKSLPEHIRDFMQAAADRNLLSAESTVGTPASAAGMRRFLTHYGIGIDCSGFVSQALNRLIALFPTATAADRIADPYNTGSGALKGGQGRFDRITDPADLCAGDTMWKSGHIRIITWAERRADGIYFCAAESSSVSDVGPSAKQWRLKPDPSGGPANFRGYKLEVSGDGRTWTTNTTTHVYGRFRPLVRLLQAQGVTATRMAAARSQDAGDYDDAVEPFQARTAITRDLTQAEIDRLAAVTFTDAAQIDTFFHRQNHTGFIDWYNATLASTAPFSARGRIDTSTLVRDRFATFWNQVPVAFDRPQITALDFAAMMAISINETSGNMWARPESSGRGGGGRTDARGRHPGLAYFFDRIELKPATATAKARWKASYNRLSGGRRAGDLFNDADFIRAHNALGNSARLANHGGEFGGAWNGDQYPQAQFGTTEDLATNGFIMQADFYKFRGRGVIQTTGRASYLRVIQYIQGYNGTNTVLQDFRRQWTGVTPQTVATISRDADWDRIFGQSIILAKGLSLHAGTRDDYRRMSTTAATLLAVPPSAGNPRGQTGSIYAMGRRISGSHAYGATTYRQRVLALLHGILALA